MNYQELYDPSTNTFKQTGNMVCPILYNTATLLNNGTVLFAGGAVSYTLNPNCPFNGSLAAANQLYDPSTGTFASTGSLQYPRTDHTATLLTDGNVLIAGGITNANSTAELYRPTTLAPPNVSAITVTPASGTIAVGTSLNLIATGNNGQQLASVTWSSSNPALVTVTNDATNSGAAYAVSAGTVQITACAGNICGQTQLTAQ